ncbi:MAG: FtsX-like permease family protein, partial [Gemmatimonadota bacterium]
VAGGVDAFPLSGGGADGTFLILNDPREVQDFDDWGRLARDASRTGYAEWRIAHADYFRAMEIPILRGRGFEQSDGPEAPHVALISESLARTRWPDEDPIGKLINFGNMDGDLRAMRIVGVVGDIRERSLAGEPRPTLYGNARQRTGGLGGPFSVAVRGPAEPAAVIAAARRIVRDLDPTVPVRFRTLESVFSDSLADRRFSLLLLGVFGLTALLVAAAGLYGLISFLVAQQTREVGIRMALGAQTRDVLELVVGQGAALAGIGIACGLLAAFGLTRFLSGMLYDVPAVDPATFGGIALLLAVVALLACYLPARRAARVDPVVALRAE